MKSGISVFIALIAVILCPLSFVQSDGAESGIMLYEVNTYGDDEGVSIHNYGTSAVDLKGFIISDNPSPDSNEGRIVFSESLRIGSGETVTIVGKDLEGSEFIGRHTTYFKGENGITYSGQFALANNGDDVYLFDSDGVTLDSFCYGSVTISDSSSWMGESFKMKKNCFAQRQDTGNTASSWFNFKVGWTNLGFDPDLEYSATVTPFVFPEHGGIPIYEALENAEDTVCITMYELTNRNVYALLCDLEDRGVDVTLLLERNPLGHDVLKSEGKYLKALSDAGGEIRLIGGDDSRYTYVHAKYCIIDSDTVIITSENWTTDNLNGEVVVNAADGDGNRGWGAIIKSSGYADYMQTVFDNDYDMSYGDVVDFDTLAVNIEAYELYYDEPETSVTLTEYSATVTPFISPDSSWSAAEYYMENSYERIYSQQQSITSSYVKLVSENPLKWMEEKAAEGIDCRFILCSANDTETVESQVNTVNMTSHIKAACMSEPYVHNKGIVCDDTAVVTSVNWTDTSFLSNRESGAAIHSSGVADFFASYFLSDFEKNYTYSGLDVTLTEIKGQYEGPCEITVTAVTAQTGDLGYSWELDGKTLSYTHARIVIDATEGTHTIKVTVTDASTGSSGSASSTFTVGSGSDDKSGDSFIDKIKAFIAPIIAVIIGIIAAVAKVFTRKNI